jgi:hypothetical protein
MDNRYFRFAIAVIVGIATSLIFYFVLRPTFIGLILGIITGSIISRTSKAKEGAFLGALIAIPVITYNTISAAYEYQTIQEEMSSGTLVLVGIMGMILVVAIGALIGASISWCIKFIRGRNTIF